MLPPNKCLTSPNNRRKEVEGKGYKCRPSQEDGGCGTWVAKYITLYGSMISDCGATEAGEQEKEEAHIRCPSH